MALPLSPGHHEVAVKHRIVSLRVAGPPARKFLPCPWRASVPSADPRRGGRVHVGCVCVCQWPLRASGVVEVTLRCERGPAQAPRGSPMARARAPTPDGSAAARGWAPGPGAHARLPPSSPGLPGVTFPAGTRSARCSAGAAVLSELSGGVWVFPTRPRVVSHRAGAASDPGGPQA